MLDILRLPLTFDVTRLRADLATVHPDEWELHFVRQNHDGGWSGVALRGVPGSVLPLYSDPGATVFADTAIMERFSYIPDVLAALRCEIKSVRLLKLAPGYRIKEHRDHCLSFDDGEVRLHVPVATNPGVEFFLGGERVEMAEGELWYLDFNQPHRVSNLGSTDRVHLVIDCMVNDWMRSIFERGHG